jgi:hypothetical protein
VVLALKVPQLAVRRQNLMSAVESLTTIASLHQTQPTIQVLLARQEFAGALDLIATSQDIIKVGRSRQLFSCLKGHGSEVDFLGFLHKPVQHRSFTLRFEPFRF